MVLNNGGILWTYHSAIGSAVLNKILKKLWAKPRNDIFYRNENFCEGAYASKPSAGAKVL